MEWYIWYGLRIGLSYDYALSLPLGELQDFIAIEQIKTEGAKMKKSRQCEEEDFFELMKWK